jgi:nitrite reductase/ring-hydroxylating ferredoxin subunit
MSATDCWYPVALSNDLEAGLSAGTRLFDREMCIWRDSDGGVHAWEDRCPHRGMRLSFGFVRGDRIACLYHGWQYDTHGECRFIPSHPELDVPRNIRVATFPCVERLGMVWVYSGLAIERPPELAVEPLDVLPVRSLYLDCVPATAAQSLAAESGNLLSAGSSLLSIDVEGLRLITGVQPFGAAKTALHIVLPGGHEGRDGGARRAASSWAEQFRNDLESSGPPDDEPIGRYEAAP